MGKQVSTVIIEPRPILREALELLLKNHSYRVVWGIGSIVEIATSSVVPDGPKLVILGAQSADNAAKGAEDIRALWPDAKIIFLFDDTSTADLQNMLVSQIDGCIALFVSSEAFISTLDQIVTGNVRIVVMDDKKRASKWPQVEPLEVESKTDKRHSNHDGHDALAATVFGLPPLARPAKEANLCDPDSCTGQAHVVEGKTPKLSEREIQILDDLAKGYANKVIARRCDIAEATVKVHMKSILRKFRVRNRTQAAIWALEHGYSGEEPKAAALKANGAAEQTCIVPLSSPTARVPPRLAAAPGRRDERLAAAVDPRPGDQPSSP